MESERKRQILDMAEQLFSERGYHATSMRDLAAALDLKGGSLYSHINSKEELLEHILDRAADEFLGAIQPLVTAPQPAEARVRAALRAHIQVIAENLDAATVYFHEWKFLTEPRRAQFVARRNEYERLWRELLTDAVNQEALREVDPKWASILILSVGNWLYHWYNPTGTLSYEAIADQFADMIFQGLAPSPTLPATPTPTGEQR